MKINLIGGILLRLVRVACYPFLVVFAIPAFVVVYILGIVVGTVEYVFCGTTRVYDTLE